MNIQIDFHCHSSYSDGVATPKEIAEKCKSDNIVAVITDHNEIRGSIMLSEKYNSTTIPGIEVGSSEGLELLVYFKDFSELEDFYIHGIEPFRNKRRMVKLRTSINDILDKLQDYNAFTSLAHPFALKKKSIRRHDPKFIEDVLHRIDAIEVYNGELTQKMNEKASELNNKINKKITLGSDSHAITTIGSVSAILDVKNKTSYDLYNSLNVNSFNELLFSKLNNVGHLKTLLTIGLKHTKYYFEKR
jgi:predicted metal-dependent phosphoesterase TrpH